MRLVPLALITTIALVLAEATPLHHTQQPFLNPDPLSSNPANSDEDVYRTHISLCPSLPPRLDHNPFLSTHQSLPLSNSSGTTAPNAANARPTSISDLRPDDFDVIIALGDSITAGLMAERSTSSDALLQHDFEVVLPHLGVRERRYVSYVTGALSPPEAFGMSLGGLIGWYRSNQDRSERSSSFKNVSTENVAEAEGTGNIWPGRSRPRPPPHPTNPDSKLPSRSSDPIIGLSHLPPPIHLPGTGVGTSTHSPQIDGLNAGRSGSTVSGLMGQVKGYVLDGLEELGVDLDEERESRSGSAGDVEGKRNTMWKLMTINIGANDLCAFCLAANTTSSDTISKANTKADTKPRVNTDDNDIESSSFAPGSAKAFAQTIKEVLEVVRDEIPNTLVEIIGMFRVSSIYALSLQTPHCTPLHLPPLFPQLPVECSCAFLPGPVGDATRKKMDKLGEEYDEAVREVVRGLMGEQRGRGKDGEGFGVVWQPGTILDLSTYPSIPSLSPIDCFHPSEQSHAHIAAGLWNTLTADEEGRKVKVPWWTDGRIGGGDEGGKRDMRPLVRCLREGDRIRL